MFNEHKPHNIADSLNGLYYDERMFAASHFSPSTVVVKNNELRTFFWRQLYTMLCGSRKITIPSNWSLNYFQLYYFIAGYIPIVKLGKNGWYPQFGGLGGVNLFYEPKFVTITNPNINSAYSKDYYIGKDCALIKFLPDYTGAYDIISMYADLLAVAVESMSINLFNARLSYIFATDDPATDATFRALFDQIAAGAPAAFMSKKLFDEDGHPRWITFDGDIGKHYVADKMIHDIQEIYNQFKMEIGIPTSGSDKRERLLTTEIERNNSGVSAMAQASIEEAQRGIELLSRLSDGTCNIKIEMRWEDESSAVLDMGADKIS